MGFGGAALAMITSLKNNARPKRKGYFDRKYKKADKCNLKHRALMQRKATPQQLAEIKRTMQLENKRERRNEIVLIVIVSLFIVLIFVLMNLKF